MLKLWQRGAFVRCLVAENYLEAVKYRRSVSAMTQISRDLQKSLNEQKEKVRNADLVLLTEIGHVFEHLTQLQAFGTTKAGGMMTSPEKLWELQF
jgi:hypothetical protein